MVLSMIRNLFWGPSMYPVEGNCRFPNIFEQLANGSVQSFTVSSECWYIAEWEIGIDVKEIDNEMHLIPFVSYQDGCFPKCRLEYYLGIKKSKYRIKMKIDLHTELNTRGLELKISDLKPELLDNGALIIEYGIRVEALQDVDKIWNFPVWVDLFNLKGKQVMVRLRENERLRCHQQIKAIHCYNPIEGHLSIAANVALQIAHGVRYQGSSPSTPIWILHRACEMGFRNAIQYCQWQLIQKPLIFCEFKKFLVAMKYDMRSYLVHLIRETNSKKKMIEILEELDMIDEMSGESMKTFMKFLLYD